MRRARGASPEAAGAFGEEQGRAEKEAIPSSRGTVRRDGEYAAGLPLSGTGFVEETRLRDLTLRRAARERGEERADPGDPQHSERR